MLSMRDRRVAEVEGFPNRMTLARREARQRLVLAMLVVAILLTAMLLTLVVLAGDSPEKILWMHVDLPKPEMLAA